ncbi:MAG: flagellar hook protein, partial [Alphaproteobacteria bacterium]|nr:flagellar hook protein [Alphaproteobacteria bacterium]
MNVPPSSIATTLGIGSGIDMAGLAVQLAEAQFAGRNERLTAKSETLERQISLAGSIRSSFSVFANALGDRLRTGDLAPVPSISNPSVASVSSPLGSVGKGSYSLEVNSLASSQTLTGPAYAAATDTVGAGTLTIRFGATSNAGFTENAARPALAIEIAAGSSLTDVANAINSQNAGLTAYVAQTAAGAQLVMKGAEGLENGFVLEATEDGANPGLSALAWQPGGDPARLVKASADAEYLLDGLLRRSASNTIANAAPGLSLSLTGTNAGAPATIGFANSTD